MKQILNLVNKIKSPILLAVLTILVVEVLQFFYPSIFIHPVTKIFQILIVVLAGLLMGYTLSRKSKWNEFTERLSVESLLIALLVFATPLVVDTVLPIILVILGWIGCLYCFVMDGYKLIKNIIKTEKPEKQRIAQIIKVTTELLTLFVAILETFNLLSSLLC